MADGPLSETETTFLFLGASSPVFNIQLNGVLQPSLNMGERHSFGKNIFVCLLGIVIGGGVRSQ